ncbi:MAG: ABC transporter ATP-binding protein [Chloroflexi bacterium]|nr:ABC transporter ATP-binding protein [Chloroflexota bacterium]
MNNNGQKPVITIENMTKLYLMGEHEVRALNGVSLTIYEGEFVAIMGPSGSGKSTMMNMLGALDKPTRGRYVLGGVDVSQLSDDALADIRNRKIGFVFQNFNLLTRTPAIEQELPLIYAGKSQRRQLAQAALELVGLGDRLDHKPSELSGGQQQRVAIARALVNEPDIILADEPTGNLDSKSGTEIMRIFQELNRERGITVIFVTHDPWIARHTRRVITLADGLVLRDEEVPEPLIAGQAQRPSDTLLN